MKVILASSEDLRGLRTSLGPTAWFVLEQLMLDATPARDNTAIVKVSVRDLAAACQLNKDTITRSLKTLRSRGLLTVLARTTSEASTLVVPAIVTELVAIDAAAAQTSTYSRKRSRPAHSEQESLFG